jgi:ABC-type lipoprotein release transport system permease subunit
MQRVAIARALINDPDIVLADEPTGALDSKTSVQIMALLTEIAKTRLVVMVTHNPELADQYANRIVKLHDGKLVSDTNPFFPTQANLTDEKRSIRKTAMGFGTALALSFTNLLTKKGRTFMTSFAGSIGIIGIAAILALANGVNNYIKNVEENTLSVYPLEIQSSGVDLASMITVSFGGGGGSDVEEGSGESGDEAGSEDSKITETKQVANTFSSIQQNDLAALKSYFDGDGGGIHQYVNTIEYTYDITPQIFASDTSDKVWQVNPDFLTSAMGMSSAMTSSYSSFGMNMSMFAPMIEDTDLLKGQYDLVAGKWPESQNELVLVLNYRGGISDYLLYLMGLRDPSELDEMLKKFQNEEEVVAPEDTLSFTNEEVLDVTFKVVPATELYTYDQAYNVWTNRSKDEAYLKQLVDSALTLNIAGIVKANPDASATSLSPGIYYTADLTYYLMDIANNSQMVKDQLANHDLNVITGKTFEEEKQPGGFDAFSMENLMTIDENAMSNAIKFNPSGFSNMDLSSLLNPQDLAKALPALPEFDIADAVSDANIETPKQEDVQKVATTMIEEYLAYCLKEGLITPEQAIAGIEKWIALPEVQKKFGEQLETLGLDTIATKLQDTISAYLQKTLEGYVEKAMASVSKQLQSSMGGAMQGLTANLANAIQFDQVAFANAFQFNMNEEELSQLLMTVMSGETNTYDGNLRKMGYSDRGKPSGISIYPIDFASKQGVIDILDNYNREKKEAQEEDKVITYTDFVGVLMSSVTEIINMISYVLVAFVAISLVVSSIMIGVITYISVLERKKEIGILRAIGARKSDIGNVFNAETLIVGLVAGLLGIGITLLLTIPANLIVASAFGIEGIAVLPLVPAVALVFISCFLTFVSGLIPSSAASRRDPVEALRSE